MDLPANFLIGTANADHQVEAFNPDYPDVWDLWEETQGLTPRGRATDFWNRYPEDIKAAADLGCRLFRFSISWARVQTSRNSFNQQALEHYRDVARTIKSHGMKCMATLHHFVWPAWLERDHDGLIGPEFPDIFAQYAEACAQNMGEFVDYWITFNEPSQLTFGYIKPWWRSTYYMPPGLPQDAGVEAEAEAIGKLIPNLFRAHAQARQRVRSHIPSAQFGVNPLVTGFPPWLQSLMDWGACQQGLGEAAFKFTNRGALVSEQGDVDLILGNITDCEQTRYSYSKPYLRTDKAFLLLPQNADQHPDLLDHELGTRSRPLTQADFSRFLHGQQLGVIQGDTWPHLAGELPSPPRSYPNYQSARVALQAGEITALYGDAFYLLPPDLPNHDQYRLIHTTCEIKDYHVAAPHGHRLLLERVNRAIARFQQELPHPAHHLNDERSEEAEVAEFVCKPTCLREVFDGCESEPGPDGHGRGLRRVRRRGRIRIGMRQDSPSLLATSRSEDSLEIKLAHYIAHEIYGDQNRVDIIPVEPEAPLKHLESKSGWLNWAWRFWGTTSLIANANWWYLGMAGRLPRQLCPPEAIGAQDFIGLDYYWGLPSWRLHHFRRLEDAAHGRFLKAPVWPQGLYHAIMRYHRWFPGQELFIVENGCTPQADEVTREVYIQRHLQQVQRAIAHGAPVRAYNYWSITSNREWGHPFDPNTDFGLHFVDLDRDAELTRQPTAAVDILRTITQGLRNTP